MKVLYSFVLLDCVRLISLRRLLYRTSPAA